MIRKSNFIHLC